MVWPARERRRSCCGRSSAAAQWASRPWNSRSARWVCTRVACHPLVDLVAAGYADGAVELAVIATGAAGHAAAPGHGAVTALAWAPDGEWLAFGTERGFACVIKAP